MTIFSHFAVSYSLQWVIMNALFRVKALQWIVMSALYSSASQTIWCGGPAVLQIRVKYPGSHPWHRVLLLFLSLLENIRVLADDGARTVTDTRTTLWVALLYRVKYLQWVFMSELYRVKDHCWNCPSLGSRSDKIEYNVCIRQSACLQIRYHYILHLQTNNHLLMY